VLSRNIADRFLHFKSRNMSDRNAARYTALAGRYGRENSGNSSVEQYLRCDNTTSN
jgi:hypothetical protein